MKDNLPNYENLSVVSSYKNKNKLSEGEKTISIIISQHNCDRMLDIGVGVGRTTKAFAKQFKQYTGIDYSLNMVEAVKKKFQIFFDYEFLYCDARNMKIFEDNSFDFVLFSFNGIDCVSHDDRLKIFEEIKRISKPNAYFAFSTHNMYSITKLYSFQFPKNPLKYFYELYRFFMVRKLNPSKSAILKNDSFMIIDGDINFKAQYYYIKPEQQITQLQQIGFEDIRVFSDKNGKEYDFKTKWKKVKEPWLYFLCRTNK